MLTTILQAIIALPSILQLLAQIVQIFKNTFGDNWPKYIADLGVAFKELNEAKTIEEKQEVAAKLSQLAARWGKQ